MTKNRGNIEYEAENKCGYGAECGENQSRIDLEERRATANVEREPIQRVAPELMELITTARKH
eukprot:scaffold12683_cov144-Skeletonema_dohrnii-CCMP3373.AAC.4